MNKPFAPAVILVASLFLGGCAAKPTQDGAAATLGGTITTGLADRAPPPGFNDPNSPLSQRVIYFDYEQSDIPPSYIEVLRAHARYIGTTPKAKVMLEGHTDERGTRELNLALGEDRATTVRRFLRAEGVAESQVGIRSFGEEKPAQPGQGEAVWALNRRVELIY